VAPGSTQTITVRLTPALEQRLVVHLQCDVALKAAPLPLALALEGFKHHVHVVVGGAVAPSLLANSGDDDSVTSAAALSGVVVRASNKPANGAAGTPGSKTLSKTASTPAPSAAAVSSAYNLALGAVALGDSVSVPLTLVNAGRYPLEYEWFFPPPPVGVHGPAAAAAAEKAATLHARRLETLVVSPLTGVVPAQSMQRCSVVFAPSRVLTLSGANGALALQCRVGAGGPVFVFKLSGSGVLPAVQASLSAHDFGTMLVHGPGHPEAACEVVLTNHENETVDVTCAWVHTPDFRVALPQSRIPGL
jgi:hypothetical protein